MKNLKRTFSLFLCVVMLLSFSATTFANPNYENDIHEPVIVAPRYMYIVATYLSRGSDWIYADMDADYNMNLRIDVKVYKNGLLVKSAYATRYGMYCAMDVNYAFEAGAKYKVEAKYTAGSESTTKTLNFTHY